jgi:hypothetical protein
VTALVRAVTVTLLLTVFWGSPAVSHLVQDIRTWREFFAETQAGAIPYVNLTKEYPVLGGILYWLMSPFIRPDDLRQTIVVHAAFMTVADYQRRPVLLARARDRAALGLAATLVLAPHCRVTAPVRHELIVTFVPVRLPGPSTPPLRTAAALWSKRPEWYPALHRPRNGGSSPWSGAGGTGSARAWCSPR